MALQTGPNSHWPDLFLFFFLKLCSPCVDADEIFLGDNVITRSQEREREHNVTGRLNLKIKQSGFLTQFVRPKKERLFWPQFQHWMRAEGCRNLCHHWWQHTKKASGDEISTQRTKESEDINITIDGVLQEALQERQRKKSQEPIPKRRVVPLSPCRIDCPLKCCDLIVPDHREEICHIFNEIKGQEQDYWLSKHVSKFKSREKNCKRNLLSVNPKLSHYSREKCLLENNMNLDNILDFLLKGFSKKYAPLAC